MVERIQEYAIANGIVRDLTLLLDVAPFSENLETRHHRDLLRMNFGETVYKKWWNLTMNGAFSVKSLYNFLNDGGLRCLVVRFFWINSCPKKINLFNWLMWKNKVLSFENLKK